MKDRYEKDKAYVFMYTHFGRVDLVLTWSEIRLGGMDLALSILFNKTEAGFERLYLVLSSQDPSALR